MLLYLHLLLLQRLGRDPAPAALARVALVPAALAPVAPVPAALAPVALVPAAPAPAGR